MLQGHILKCCRYIHTVPTKTSFRINRGCYSSDTVLLSVFVCHLFVLVGNRLLFVCDSSVIRLLLTSDSCVTRLYLSATRLHSSDTRLLLVCYSAITGTCGFESFRRDYLITYHKMRVVADKLLHVPASGLRGPLFQKQCYTEFGFQLYRMI